MVAVLGAEAGRHSRKKRLICPAPGGRPVPRISWAPMPATAAKPKTSKAVNSPYKDRLTRLRAALQGQNLAHVLITNPLDVGYLTGFFGGDSYLVVSPNAARVR